MKPINLNNYAEKIKKLNEFVNSVILYDGKEILIKDLLALNKKENIPEGIYSKNEGMEKSDKIAEALKKLFPDFKLFFDHCYDVSEKLQSKAGLYVLAENMQYDDPLWKYSSHKNIVYWWLLSDGTLIAENESVKYGISFVSKKLKQFEINDVVFDFDK